MKKLIRPAIFLLSAIPLLRLFYLGYTDDLTANPVEFIQRSTGTWTLVFLTITLAVTPLRRFTPISLQPYRRQLGLWVMFYAFLHFLTWSYLDNSFDLTAIAKDIVKRPFITAGFAGFALLLPLALTSNGYSIRLLKQNWAKLHKLIYAIAIVALLHYYWHKAGKHDFFVVNIYASILGALLASRLIPKKGN